MKINFEVNEIPNQRARERLEGQIRGCLLDGPEHEDWTFWIYVPTHSPSGYRLVVRKGSEGGGRRLFQSADSFVAALSVS